MILPLRGALRWKYILYIRISELCKSGGMEQLFFHLINYLMLKSLYFVYY